MPECIVCGEAEFEEHDGHYFCSTCNTQSQDLRVIELEEEDFSAVRTHGRIREASQQVTRKKGVQPGRPWSLYEAYTIIIKHQVEALIKLGAETELEDIVFSIWTNYLHKLKVAFADNIAEQTGVKYERQRDLFMGTTENPKVLNLYGQISNAKRFGSSAKRVQKQMEQDQNRETLKDEEFYEEDDPLNNPDDDDDSDFEFEEDDDERWGRYRKSVKFNSIEKIRMTSTLAICWLGLMYTNPLTTVVDLIRWVKEEKVPYLNPKPLLDDDMQFCLNDWKCFSMGVAPTVSQLRQNAGSIAYLLKLDNIPDFPMKELANKFIIQLDLPVEVHSYVINLFSSMPVPRNFRPTDRVKKVWGWENTAMAFIIIFMKFFFGLNDSNEILISEYSKSLEELAESPRQLFIWTDWIQHMKNRMLFSKQIQLRKTKKRMLSEMLTSRVNQKSSFRPVKHKGRLRNKQFRTKIGQPFATLCQRWKCKESVSGQASQSQQSHLDSESFHLDNDTYSDDHIISNILNGSNEETNYLQSIKRQDLTPKELEVMQQLQTSREKFRNCTIQHIISPDTFINDLKKRDKEADNQSTHDDDHNDNICSSILSSSCEPRAIKRARMTNQQHHSSMDTEENFEDIVLKDIAKFEEVVRKMSNIKENMKTSLDCDSDEKVCLSYDWLLKVCSFVSDCEQTELQNAVKYLEMRFFTSSGKAENVVQNAVKENYKVGKSKPRCEFCNKAFMDKYSLQLHSKVHTGNGSFECQFCEKTYKRKGDLRVHMRNKHESELSE